MAPKTVVVKDDKSQVYVTNLREVRAWMRKLHPDLVPVLRDRLKGAVTTTVVPNVRKNMPQRSGRAKASVRAVSGGNTIYVVHGSKKAPHVGWLDFGGALKPTGKRRGFQQRPVVKRGRYMYPGIDASSAALADAAGRAVDSVIN
jgi:hypothetical protein